MELKAVEANMVSKTTKVKSKSEHTASVRLRRTLPGIGEAGDEIATIAYRAGVTPNWVVDGIKGGLCDLS